ncbi:hypothetical protein CDD83_3927 [Cordyceps sp. RAO-2017]|nr:hypothetical protein CDD83_3927 [Cordyceps sp. RAO-2017]
MTAAAATMGEDAYVMAVPTLEDSSLSKCIFGLSLQSHSLNSSVRLRLRRHTHNQVDRQTKSTDIRQPRLRQSAPELETAWNCDPRGTIAAAAREPPTGSRAGSQADQGLISPQTDIQTDLTSSRQTYMEDGSKGEKGKAGPDERVGRRSRKGNKAKSQRTSPLRRRLATHSIGSQGKTSKGNSKTHAPFRTTYRDPQPQAGPRETQLQHKRRRTGRAGQSKPARPELHRTACCGGRWPASRTARGEYRHAGVCCVYGNRVRLIHDALDPSVHPRLEPWPSAVDEAPMEAYTQPPISYIPSPPPATYQAHIWPYTGIRHDMSAAAYESSPSPARPAVVPCASLQQQRPPVRRRSSAPAQPGPLHRLRQST